MNRNQETTFSAVASSHFGNNNQQRRDTEFTQDDFPSLGGGSGGSSSMNNNQRFNQLNQQSQMNNQLAMQQQQIQLQQQVLQQQQQHQLNINNPQLNSVSIQHLQQQQVSQPERSSDEMASFMYRSGDQNPSASIVGSRLPINQQQQQQQALYLQQQNIQLTQHLSNQNQNINRKANVNLNMNAKIPNSQILQQQQQSATMNANGMSTRGLPFTLPTQPLYWDDPTNTQTTSQFNSHPSLKNQTIGQEAYTLLGLLDIIKMTHPDKTMLSLGIDLTTLGLSLSSFDPLYSSFMSPFTADPAIGADQVYKLPVCYQPAHPIPPLLTKIKLLSEDALFYLFYTLTRQTPQEAAAQELYIRGWRFHRELRLWLTKDPTSDRVVKGLGFERGIYLFFDSLNWTRVKKEFVLHYDLLEERRDLMALSVQKNEDDERDVDEERLE